MSCEIVVRQCERCDLTEGTVLCQECAGKEESDPVCYCGTCSDLVHKGRIAKHTLTFVKTDVSKVNKDEAESLITKYKRELSCLSKKIDEVEKAKENVNEFMQKHDKAIRQTITAVVRQLQERGKCFIQQVAARSSEKKEQLTAIQAQLQDAQSGINQQICNLEEILKKLESRDKLEIASIEAAMKETETEVQGKIDETFKTVKLPELDTEFDIDTNSVAEAVQALEINIHPEPSDEIVADRNNIEVPKLNISQVGDEKPMIEAFVSGPLMRNSVFWVVPRFTKEVESKLHRLSTLIRKVYIENPAWKSFDDSGTQPTVGDDVYALYDADHKWYRGCVEDTKSSRNGSTVRFTDYGNTQNVTHANILPASDSLAPRCHQQAMRCCLQETLEKLLPNEARWAFSDATGDTVLNMTFQKQVKRDGVDAWLTDVKVPLPDGTFNDVNALIMEKVIEDNNPKSTITCKDIRYANVSPSSGTPAPGRVKGASDTPMSAAGGSMSRRLASEDQMSNLAQISAILGSGGGMRRDRPTKAEEAELKRQAKRERKLKRQRKPEATSVPDAEEQQVVEEDMAPTDDVDGGPDKLGIAQSRVLPALGLEHVRLAEDTVDGVPAIVDSAEGDDNACSSATRDDSGRAIDATTGSGAETQNCTTEGEQSGDAPDATAPVDLSSVCAEATGVSPAGTCVLPISAASPSQDGAVALSQCDHSVSSLNGDATGLQHDYSTHLLETDVISSANDDATTLASSGCIFLPKGGDVVPQDGATDDIASAAVIELETDTSTDQPCPGTDQDFELSEPVTTVDESPELVVADDVAGTGEDNVEMSPSCEQGCVDALVSDIVVTSPASDACCDCVLTDAVPSIPQTDGTADTIEEAPLVIGDICLSVSLDDDTPGQEDDTHTDVLSVGNDISVDSVKSYRASSPTLPTIHALVESTGVSGASLPVDSEHKQCQMADCNSNTSGNRHDNLHDKHASKLAENSEEPANSDLAPKKVVSPDSPAHCSTKPAGCKPKSKGPPIENVLPKAKLYHGGEFQVRVTSDLQKNGQFWVELVRDSLAERAYQHMLSQFKEMSKLATTVHPVNPGVLVLCPGEKDSWHRGRVSEIKGNKVDVCMIDCGRNINVPVGSLKELIEQFHRIPYQAVMCSIARKDYTQFGEKGQQLFKEKVQGRQLLAKVITVGGTGSFVFVDLLDCSTPDSCNIYQLIYDKIPEERPVKQIPRPGGAMQACVRNGEQGETVVPYPYVTASIHSGMPVGLSIPYHPVPVIGDSGTAEPARPMSDAGLHAKSVASYMTLPFYQTGAVYPPSNANYTMPPQMLQPGGMSVDSSSCAGTMPPLPAYMPHHDAAGTFCAKATMQGSGDATHNHVAFITSSLPGAHQDMHESQPSSATGSEVECDDDTWVEEDRKTKQMDKQNWRQRSDHQDRHYHRGGGSGMWGRAKDDIICYGCQKRGHLNRDCPNVGRRPMDTVGSWPGKGRDPKRGSRGGGGGGPRGGPRGAESSRGGAPGQRQSGRRNRNTRPSGGRQNYTSDEGGPAASSGGRVGSRKSSWPVATESWED